MIDIKGKIAKLLALADTWDSDATPNCSDCEAHTSEFRNQDPVHGFVKYNHTCSAGGAPRKIRGRDARTSPAWCPKRKGEPICHVNQSQNTEK